MAEERPIITFMAVDRMETTDKTHLTIEGMATYQTGESKRVRVFCTIDRIEPI